MSIHAQQEWDEKVVRVPKRLKRLLSYPVVSGRVHQEHAEKHDMSSNSARLRVMNLYRSFWADLGLFDVEEVDVVGSCMDTAE